MITLDNFSSLVFGAAISGVIGLFFILIGQHYKEKNERRRIAKGFYLEIIELKEIISPIVEKHRAAGETVGSPFTLSTLVQETHFDVSQALYTDNGWYFVFQKDLVLFDKDLLEAVIRFYRAIIHASALVEEYFKEISSSCDTDRLYTVQDKFFESLDIAYNLAPSLLIRFSRYDTKERVKQWIAFNIASISEA